MSSSPLGPIRKEARVVLERSGVAVYGETDAWMFGHDMVFTSALGSAGLIGLTWPRELGGRALSARDRMAVTEELLRVGAPVAAHWIADRQIGPAILRYGSPELQRDLLPRIATGELTFCLGMSETESGSDLAAVRTRAVAVEGGFVITGRKIWTSHAHRASFAYVLARTGTAEDRHSGLTEFVVDMSAPGVEVRPILDLRGEHHFNEISFDEVFVPASRVIGKVGQGWSQVTEQLSYERGGMERVLSTFPLLAVAIRDACLDPETDAVGLGSVVARLVALRGLAVQIAALVDAGKAPERRAAILKYLGTTFEGDLVEFCRSLLDRPPIPGASPFETLLTQGITRSPGATLRGGTTEVLLGIIAKGIGTSGRIGGLHDTIGDAVEDLASEDGDGLGAVWTRATDLGWTGVTVAESAGGSGGYLADLATIVRVLAARGLSAPIAESALAAGAIANAWADVDIDVPRAACGKAGLVLKGTSRLTVSGRVDGVRWANEVAELVLVASSAGERQLIRVSRDARGLTVLPRLNLAGEPCADVLLDAVAVEVIGQVEQVQRLETQLLILRCAMLTGAMEGALALATEHASVRHQFGRPLLAFQAVTHLLARADSQVALALSALDIALLEAAHNRARWRSVAAHVVIADAATVVARDTHQVLGAMGMTREHPLHRMTLRLWAWRDDVAGRRQSATALGRSAIAAGVENLWEWLVDMEDDLLPRTDGG